MRNTIGLIIIYVQLIFAHFLPYDDNYGVFLSLLLISVIFTILLIRDMIKERRVSLSNFVVLLCGNPFTILGIVYLYQFLTGTLFFKSG